MTSIPSEADLFLRAPDGKVHRVELCNEHAIIHVFSLEQAHGQWLVYTNNKTKRLTGIGRSLRLENIGGTLLFNVEMTDTGEEFLVIRHILGITVICIQFSPAKCTVENYHKYLESYTHLIAVPASAERSIAGGAAVEGREPTYHEKTFRFIKKIVRIMDAANLVKSDLSKHVRGRGGESGIDAQETLRAWKIRPDWYKASKSLPAIAKKSDSALLLGDVLITPLRAVRKEAIGSNLFTGAASIALGNLARLIGNGGVGGLVASMLSATSNRIYALDTPTPMSEADAWTYLESKNHPPRSESFARLLLQIRADYYDEVAHLPSFGATGPFLLTAPELIFQEFVTAKCLVALGLPRARVVDALTEARSPKGCTFANFVAWADTSLHSLAGWRDQTNKPAGYEPDLIIVDNLRKRTLLLDAKFRRDSTGLLPSSGIKDIQAYMHEYELPRAVLAVPIVQDEPISESIEARGFMVFGFGISPGIDELDLRLLAHELDGSWNDKLVTKGT